jgi:hypothetical protein
MVTSRSPANVSRVWGTGNLSASHSHLRGCARWSRPDRAQRHNRAIRWLRETTCSSITVTAHTYAHLYDTLANALDSLTTPKTNDSA